MEPVLFGLTLIDIAVIAGVALVLPACLGGHRGRWSAVAVCVAAACALDRGSFAAVALALTWPANGLVVTWEVVRRAGPPRRWTHGSIALLAACAYALAAAIWFVISRAGLTPMGVHEPIVELTAVHFTYVGVAAVTLAEAALAGVHRDPGGRTPARALGWAALGLTIGAPPVVALGFVTGAGFAQVGGAVLMSLGVFATAALQLREAANGLVTGNSRVLLVVSGLAIWAPMVLAVSWAAGQHWDVPALGIPDMVRTHGAVNALAFVGAGLLARSIAIRDDDRRSAPMPATSQGNLR